MTMDYRPIPKADLLAMIAAQPDGAYFAWWPGGGLSVTGPDGTYLGYLDLVGRHLFVAAGEGALSVFGDFG